MSTFFEKYKKMRKDQKIDLTDIESRTKINIKYLEAIENGDFEVIQEPYLRLFIKAYINEIGADPGIAIDELNEFLLNKDNPIPIKKPSSDDKTEVHEKVKKQEKKNFGDKKSEPDEPPRQKIKKEKQSGVSVNLIKGIIFIIVWIIIIIVIRSLTLDTDSNESGISQSQYNNSGLISNFVDFEQIEADFMENGSQQIALDVTAPYLVKIVSRNTLGIVSKKDTLNILSQPIAAGSQRSINFDSSLDVLLKHANGVTVYINGELVNGIDSKDNPVRLTFSTDPNTVLIRNYLPIE